VNGLGIRGSRFVFFQNLEENSDHNLVAVLEGLVQSPAGCEQPLCFGNHSRLSWFVRGHLYVLNHNRLNSALVILIFLNYLLCPLKTLAYY
jgi:hypothetical protein